MDKKRNIALGFYQERSTAEEVLKELKRLKLSSCAAIHHKKEDIFEIDRFFPKTLFLLPIAVLAILTSLFYAKEHELFPHDWSSLAALASALLLCLGFYAYRLFSGVISFEAIERFKKLLLVDEFLIIAEVKNEEARQILTTLRHVKSGHPVTFLLRFDMVHEGEIDIPMEPLTIDQLKEGAQKLAQSLQETSRGYQKTKSLMDRFAKSSEMLHFLRHDLADSEFIEQTIPSSAEWLLDNMYVVEASIEDVKVNLPKKYYKELPKILEGPLKGLPRIYALAIELIRANVGRLDREIMTTFLESYQLNHPLTIGELWAFPMILRLRLIEWIEYLTVRVDNRMREGVLASFWGNRLLNAAKHDPKRFPLFLVELSRVERIFSGHFAEELLDYLFDEESILPVVRQWLEERFGASLEGILHQEHLEETSEQLVFSNSIKSLITLSQLSWQAIFESVNPVDAIFQKDPLDVYRKMDFATRNSYRQTIEQVARRVKIGEVDVAAKTLALAQEGVKEYEKHIGYYLIDKGREKLEKKIGYQPPFLDSLRRWMHRHPAAVYLGGISLTILLLESLLFHLLQKSGASLGSSFLFLFLSLLPFSELSVQTVTFFLTMVLQTSLRPKMLFEKGIPQENKTLVVVPMMLITLSSIQEEIERLEIRYLANSDPQLSFALFSDFTDAKEQYTEKDAPLLKAAIEGLETLQKKYPKGKFFLFHRQRVWSECENGWIGYERKRGKLEALNAFLMREKLAEKIVYLGNPEALKGIRYVITLDADTQLPKDQAKAMVEVLSHPLNRPYLAADKKRLERGYTIIQPRVGTDFVQSKASWFSKIFSEPTAVDPYTLAISNLYQDLVGEGSYHGKGLYDVEAFHTLLSHSFPEDHLLSHDLIEGAFVRVGFASTICLFDMHPKDYFTWSHRQHRWMRGDWQIIDWLFPFVPTRKGRVRNPLSWDNRWKIADNLRRSLLPLSLVVLLTTAWIFSSLPGLFTSLVTLVLILPFLSVCLNKVFTNPVRQNRSLFRELKILLLRFFVAVALLPYEAFLSVDALIRVAFRRCISHRNLLQWRTGDYACHGLKEHQTFLLHILWVSLFALALFGAILLVNPYASPYAGSFCFLWLLAPLVIKIIDKPLDQAMDEELSDSEIQFLRKLGRKTWRFFDELVGPQTHWLPPDNYQVALNVEIAQRTSPTNIGMWLLALMNARDFNYISCDLLIDKAFATLQELKKFERHQGHFLNWYNIQTAEPLYPRYVSTVDSGNLLASFWTLKQGIDELILSPIIPTEAFFGIRDSYEILRETNQEIKIGEIEGLFKPGQANDLSLFAEGIKKAAKALEEVSFEKVDPYWLKQLQEQIRDWESILYRYFSWVEILLSLPKESFKALDPSAMLWRDQALSWQPSLECLASHRGLAAIEKLIAAAEREGLPKETILWAKKLQEAFSTARWFAGEKLGLVTESLKTLEAFSREMDLSFLYNSDRKLFAIGYTIEERRLDASFYDLLASEARLASFIAIAKEDVPLEHWWALGRLFSLVNGQKVLLSWGGTMFEYLMPLLFNKQYSDSLIGEACEAAVSCQIAYGKRRGIPWGISESAFSAIDSHKIYQYKSFGVPGLGLKRGLEDDLVVSPYSSVLALAVKPKAAMKNIMEMAKEGHHSMMGAYGFYESIDFTRQRSPSGERGVIVYVYMAHHQGMIFGTINNLLNQESLIKRFHKDPRICGVNSLLYERLSSTPPIKITEIRKQPTLRRLEPFSTTPHLEVVETAESLTPKINLLSNQKYSLMITNSGGGYSRWGDCELYRWRSDTTRDAWGSFCYLQDMKSREIWSTTYQPTQTSGKEYSANFKGDKAEFRRKEDQIETFTEIVVSPEDNAEIRLTTLINHSSETRDIQLTSYLELCLAPHLADRAHPCFNKLFIETEAFPEVSALLGFRRLRTPDDPPVWAFHLVAMSQQPSREIEYETERGRFVGRGRTLKNPIALEGNLANTTGKVLDPIFSLRRRVVIEPGKRVQLSFVTGVADNREAALALIEKYKEIGASHRALEMAWNYAQLELRHLRLHQEEVQLFQKLASRLLYPHSQLRSPEERLRKNRLGQSGLWPQGISGDLPILVVTVGDIYDVDLVKQLLMAHAFWSYRGLKVDLVILNEEATGYLQPLQEHIQSQIQAHSYRNQVDTPGGVFLRSTDHLLPEELDLILSVARVVLVASRGLLRQQLVSPKKRVAYPAKLVTNEKVGEEPSRPLPFMELPYFNGLGGYSPDGGFYVIYLGPNSHTPAPWINVLANPHFGTLVSEAGLGMSWYGNSQTNRLTPWSNDPLLDPITDTLYIRDEEMGTFWTPTPAPIRELDAYRISHTQGYTRFEHNSHGIEQELVVFVPVNEEGGLPLRIQRLRLTNHSSRRRKLSLTTYTEWVLGGDREEMQLHVMTNWDSESQALFACNYYNPHFGSRVAFASASLPLSSFTGDRTEFLGRNRSTACPEALTRIGLSGHTGAALDPCAALQLIVEIDSGKEIEVDFTIGFASDAVEARRLVSEMRKSGRVEALLSETVAWWNKTLGTIQVELPDQATNFALNRWLLYQDLACRFWGRSGFYQSSGAYGFRDQLQDSMAFVYSLPALSREYILKAAARQYVEGDVQHWWHPESGAGIRTRCSDDLLWLPFVVAHYVRLTGDRSILDEKVSFIEGSPLEDHQEELFQIPTLSKEEGTLLEHCRRSLEKGKSAGPHGLPLIGSCDWNDGMNRVGIKGKGESVWLGWFLIHVMNDFADLLTFKSGESCSGEGFRAEAKRLAAVIEATAWDGAWYRRAYFDDGTPIGSKESVEAIIDSLTQSWAIISGSADLDRGALALKSADDYLVKEKENLVLLLTPPFDKIPEDPGYIKGYPPGVRENGGQYSHGSSWLAMAYARVGQGGRAADLLRMISPTLHTQTAEANECYKVEPYVIAGDIYDLKGKEGRGGWTWYTGAAGWIYRIWLEEILGFTLRGQTLTFNFSLPKEWDHFKVTYRYRSSHYAINVANPHHLARGKAIIHLDGVLLADPEIRLVDDGLQHTVEILLEPVKD